MGDNVTQTARQDLNDWARGYGQSGLASFVKQFFPNASFNDKGEILFTGAPGSYDEIGGVYRPMLDDFTELEKSGRTHAINQVLSGADLRNQADRWMLDRMDGQGDDLAQLVQSYNMGGPLAGASRVGLLDALQGNQQKFSQQRLLDNMSGRMPGAADNRIYGMLGSEGDYTRDAAFDTIGGSLAGGARAESAESMRGPLAEDARRSSSDTINGRFLGSGSNPWFRSTVDEGTKAIADAYKYATMPEMVGNAARSGTFGGSAHQQTAAMKQFELGRNLSDFVNKMYSDNYSRERQNQISAANAERGYTQQAIGAERGYSQNALEAERGRGYSAAENALSRAQQAALDERGGWRSLLDAQNNRMLSSSEGELGRGIQTMSLFPELMRGRFDEADVLRKLGSEERQLSEAGKEVKYQNDLTAFQSPFNLYNLLGSTIASMTGGGGVTTTTSPNPNAISPIAGWLGGGLAGAGALADIFSPRQPAAAAPTPG